MDMLSVQVCHEQLLQHPEQQLLEKENSGCEALLRDNKVHARVHAHVQCACACPCDA